MQNVTLYKEEWYNSQYGWKGTLYQSNLLRGIDNKTIYIWPTFSVKSVFYTSWNIEKSLKSVQDMVRLHIFLIFSFLAKICKRTITWTDFTETILKGSCTTDQAVPKQLTVPLNKSPCIIGGPYALKLSSIFKSTLVDSSVLV